MRWSAVFVIVRFSYSDLFREQTLRNCAPAAGPFLRKSPNTVSIHRTVLKPLLFQHCLVDCKILIFYPLRIGNTPNSHKLEAHSKSQYTVYNRGPRGTANAQRFFFLNWWAKCRCLGVPSKFCCGRVSCPVTRLPSCGRLHRQTVKPLPPPTCVVSSPTQMFGWTDHGASTTSSGANTTKTSSE